MRCHCAIRSHRLVVQIAGDLKSTRLEVRAGGRGTRRRIEVTPVHTVNLVPGRHRLLRYRRLLILNALARAHLISEIK